MMPSKRTTLSATRVIAFDVYGTIIDVGALETSLEGPFGAHAKQASRLWREKQLEFSFRRGLMRKYVNFDVCTEQALLYVSQHMGVLLERNEKRALLAAYLRLPAFPGVKKALSTLKEGGNTLVALTNGTERSVRAVLGHAGVSQFFEAILSVDTIKTFKPDPAVYEHLVRSVKRPKRNIWLVSSNPFDVIGAKGCGLNTVWLRREAARTFDPWGFPPDATVGSLEELRDALHGKA
jgi:2-haloacid dehalogenase